MTRLHARTQRFRLPSGSWARQHSVQLVTLGMLVAVFFACCNPPAWPALIWQRVTHDGGTVHMTFMRVTLPDATGVETCFVQSYHRCTAATLYASFSNFDRGANYRFVIEPYGFTYAIGVIWDIAPSINVGASGFSYCSSMRLEANGLRVLGCQRIGDVSVPGGG